MPVYNKRGILLLPKVIVLNPKDGSIWKETCFKMSFSPNDLQILLQDNIMINSLKRDKNVVFYGTISRFVPNSII